MSPLTQTCLAAKKYTDQQGKADPSTSPLAEVTVITATSPPLLSKQVSLDTDGHLVKNAAAQMMAGRADRVSVANLSEFSDVLKNLQPNQALTFGITNYESIHLTTKDQYEQRGRPANCIPRTKDFFNYPPGAAIMMIDYDPPDGTSTTFDRNGLVAVLRTAIPGLEQAVLLWNASSSSFIFNNETEIFGLNGQRLYAAVMSGTDIPRTAKAMVENLWAAGYGYYTVGVAGQLLERCLIDASVYQPNRLDFAAGAITEPPLVQRRGDPVLIPGDIEFVNTAAAIPDPGPDIIALAKANREKARAAVQDEAKNKKETYIAAKATAIAGPNATDETLRLAEATARRAVEHSTLAGDYPVIVIEHGKESAVTVGEILDNPTRFHGLPTLDPIEPEYKDRRHVAKLFLFGSRQNLFSFARGGRVFKLIRQPARIEIIRGKTYETVCQCLDLMRSACDIFDMGTVPVIVDNGRIYPLAEPGLTHELAAQIQFFVKKQTKKGESTELLEDPPVKVVKALIALNDRRGLNKLDAAVDMPLLRTDGSLLNKPGYDEKTNLFIDIPEPVELPEPTLENCKAALHRLMHPFREFPLCTPTDWGVLLSVLLTAVIRAVLGISPAFAFDAPVQGSGKTLLARCIAILATGTEASVWPHTASRDDEEMRKRVFSALREGSRAIIVDNVLGILSSASLAAALTSSFFQDRILGKSESQSVPNRALFLITGNNICLAGDLPRRILTVRMDPKMESPIGRVFTMQPAAYCLANRQCMVVDAITIMRGAFRHYDAPTDNVGFEDWNNLVRRAVLFAGDKLSPGDFADPKLALIETQHTDPEQEELFALLQAWFNAFGDNAVTARDVVAFSLNQNLAASSYHPELATTAHFVELAEVIADIMEGRTVTAKGFGHVCRNKKDRIVGGLVLREVPAREKATKKWAVMKV